MIIMTVGACDMQKEVMRNVMYEFKLHRLLLIAFAIGWGSVASAVRTQSPGSVTGVITRFHSSAANTLRPGDFILAARKTPPFRAGM